MMLLLVRAKCTVYPYLCVICRVLLICAFITNASKTLLHYRYPGFLSNLDVSRTVGRRGLNLHRTDLFRDDIAKCSQITTVIATIFVECKRKQEIHDGQQRKRIVCNSYISFISTLFRTLVVVLY